MTPTQQQVTIIAIRVKGGYINNLDKEELLTKDKFKLGGQTTLRGWNKPSNTALTNAALIYEMLKYILN